MHFIINWKRKKLSPHHLTVWEAVNQHKYKSAPPQKKKTSIRTVTTDILSFVTQWGIFLQHGSLNHPLSGKRERER